MPRMFILSGCNGSGKTTASYALLPKILECSEFVNSDEFAKALSPFNPDQAYVTASRYMLTKTKYLFRQRADFCIETTLATRSLGKMVKAAQEQGYFVTVLYFWLSSPDLAVERVKARVAAGGHFIPDDVVRRRYIVGLNYFLRDYVPACDRWILADNSEPPFTIVGEGSRQRTVIRDLALYNRIRATALDDSDLERLQIRELLRPRKSVSPGSVAKDGVPIEILEQ